MSATHVTIIVCLLSSILGALVALGKLTIPQTLVERAAEAAGAFLLGLVIKRPPMVRKALGLPTATIPITYDDGSGR